MVVPSLHGRFGGVATEDATPPHVPDTQRCESIRKRGAAVIERVTRLHVLEDEGDYTHALESFEEYLFAMLRAVKNVPGRASKIVLSLTRLSEHPRKRKGGPAVISLVR